MEKVYLAYGKILSLFGFGNKTLSRTEITKLLLDWRLVREVDSEKVYFTPGPREAWIDPACLSEAEAVRIWLALVLHQAHIPARPKTIFDGVRDVHFEPEVTLDRYFPINNGWRIYDESFLDAVKILEDLRLVVVLPNGFLQPTKLGFLLVNEPFFARRFFSLFRLLSAGETIPMGYKQVSQAWPEWLQFFVSTVPCLMAGELRFSQDQKAWNIFWGDETSPLIRQIRAFEAVSGDGISVERHEVSEWELELLALKMWGMIEKRDGVWRLKESALTTDFSQF